MMRRVATVRSFLILMLILPPVAASQEWPAGVSLSAGVPQEGKLVIGTGFDLGVKTDAGPGELNRLWRVLPVVARVGVSSNTEVIGTWRGGLLARSGDGGKHSDWGDPSLFTKITLTDSGLPFAAGVMFGFKIPSTRYLPHRLGSDAADLYFRLLASWDLGRAEFRVNGGASIIGDPRHTGSQDDLLTGSTMLIVRPAGAWRLFAEFSGFTGPKEDDDKLQFRGGSGFDTGFVTVSLYGNARIAGSPVDFGTAFEGTGSWGMGLSLTRTIGL